MAIDFMLNPSSGRWRAPHGTGQVYTPIAPACYRTPLLVAGAVDNALWRVIAIAAPGVSSR